MKVALISIAIILIGIVIIVLIMIYAVDKLIDWYARRMVRKQMLEEFKQLSSYDMKKTPIKILREIHTPVLDGKYFISYNDAIQFITLDENEALFQNVMVHPFQHHVGVWSIKTYVFK